GATASSSSRSSSTSRRERTASEPREFALYQKGGIRKGHPFSFIKGVAIMQRKTAARVYRIAMAAALSLPGAGMWAQQPAAAPAPQTKPLVSAGANEVVLDVVVRDKKGRSVRDLEAAHFEVGDNGEPVKIRSF